jgi:CRISPR-associated endonuclease/helicase Cas3
LLLELVRRLRELRCTVIILSATLTTARRREFMQLAGPVIEPLSDAYPLLTACVENQPQQQIQFSAEPSRLIRVTTLGANAADLSEQALARAAAGQCVLWVHNTVREAQES